MENFEMIMICAVDEMAERVANRLTAGLDQMAEDRATAARAAVLDEPHDPAALKKQLEDTLKVLGEKQTALGALAQRSNATALAHAVLAEKAGAYARTSGKMFGELIQLYPSMPAETVRALRLLQQVADALDETASTS